MDNYAVIGLGLMGKAICYDLLTFDEKNVIGFEIDDERRYLVDGEFSNFRNRFKSQKLSLTIYDNPVTDPLVSIFKENDIKVVFGAIDYKFNEYLTQICIASGSSYLDLGGNPNIVKKQFLLNDKAINSKITVVPDCGLAPGMVNVIAAHVMSQFDSLENCEVRVGGLPQNPKTILNYQQVFSIRGLTNEYLEDAIVIRDGYKQFVSSLTEIESLEFPEPWGTLEAFQTAGGTSNLPDLYEGKINNLTYKTIRFPGHCYIFKFLKDYDFLSSNKILSNMSAREVSEYLLQKHLPKNEPDVVLVRIKVVGKKESSNLTKVYDLIDLYDEKTGYSAMARTTAFPISIIGQMIMKKNLNKKGVIAGELEIPKIEFLDELAKRNIKFTTKTIYS